ncbi:hypothetical protein PFISCL1PPCAC_11504, partial [Pristionchus fissidentatus]
LDTTALRNGTLHLSYGSFNYPYFYPRSSWRKQPIGFLTDVWKEFTSSLEYHQYPFEHSSSVCDGILLPVQQGMAISTAGAYTPNLMRLIFRRGSGNIWHFQFNFYEADRAADQQSTALVYALGSFLHFLIGSIREINDESRVKRHAIVDVTRAASHVIFMVGVTLAVFYHQAGFKGNTVTYQNTAQTSFADLVKSLHDGSRQLMTKSAMTFSANQLYALVGNRTSRSDVAEPDQTQLLQRLCDDHKLVAMMEPNAVYSMSMVKRPCELSKVTIPQPWKFLENFDREIVQTYMMSWNYTRRITVESVDQVLLRMYPQDMIESFWTHRYLRSFKRKPSLRAIPVKKEEFQPMSLTRLQLLLYIAGPGWFVAIVVFLVELDPLRVT